MRAEPPPPKCLARNKWHKVWRCLLDSGHSGKFHDYAGSRWTARDEP